MFGYQQPLGRLARWPLKTIPKKMVMPILSGPKSWPMVGLRHAHSRVLDRLV